jgi:hypothetical protein
MPFDSGCTHTLPFQTPPLRCCCKDERKASELVPTKDQEGNNGTTIPPESSILRARCAYAAGHERL